MSNSALVAAVEAATASGNVIEKAEHDRAIAQVKAAADQDRATAVAAAKADGAKEGAAAERARISVIMTGEHAKGRETLAQSLALTTPMSAEDAVAFLKRQPAVSASRLDGRVPDPQLSADDGSRKPDAAAAWDHAVSVVNKPARVFGGAK